MTFESFTVKILESVKPGMEFANPGGGVSVVLRTNDERIVYQRGHTQISLKLALLFRAYQVFCGTIVTTSMLKRFDHSFDSAARSPAGHSCNCTFAFIAMRESKLGGEIDAKRPMSQRWFK